MLMKPSLNLREREREIECVPQPMCGKRGGRVKSDARRNEEREKDRQRERERERQRVRERESILVW